MQGTYVSNRCNSFLYDLYAYSFMKNKTKVVEVYLLVATILSVGVISTVTTPQHQAKAIWFCGACVRGVSGGNAGNKNINVQSQTNSGAAVVIFSIGLVTDKVIRALIRFTKSKLSDTEEALLPRKGA